MLILMTTVLCLDLATISPVEAYLDWVDAYHAGDGNTVYELYNDYGQGMCRDRAGGSTDFAKLNEAALFFARRLFYQEDANPPRERINAKRTIVAQEQMDEKSWMLQNADGDLIMLMNEGKGWKVDNIFPQSMWEKAKQPEPAPKPDGGK
jgi:hypothetical protein